MIKRGQVQAVWILFKSTFLVPVLFQTRRPSLQPPSRWRSEQKVCVPLSDWKSSSYQLIDSHAMQGKPRSKWTHSIPQSSGFSPCPAAASAAGALTALLVRCSLPSNKADASQERVKSILWAFRPTELHFLFSSKYTSAPLTSCCLTTCASLVKEKKNFLDLKV